MSRRTFWNQYFCFSQLTQQYSHFEKEAIEKSLDVRSCIDPVRNAWKNAQIVIINEAEKCMLQKFEESRSFDLDIRSKASEITNNMFEYKYRASGCLDKSGLFPAFRTKTCLAMVNIFFFFWECELILLINLLWTF